MSARFWLVVAFVLCTVVLGCGGASPGAKSSGGAAGGAMPAMEAQATAMPMDEDVSADATDAPPPPPAPMPVMQADRAVARDSRAGPERPPVAIPTKPAVGSPGVQAAPGTSPTPKPAAAAQLLVYTADLHLRVEDVTKAIDAVERIAKRSGGYLVVRQDNRITVRVPSGKLDPALEQVMELGDVLHKNVSIEDVTDLYFDLQTRMKNLEVVKKRLEELLEKARTVDESLAVQRQLERVTTELERLRGKLKLLSELVLFSTVTVVFEPKSNEAIDSKVRLPFPWMDRLGLGELLRL